MLTPTEEQKKQILLSDPNAQGWLNAILANANADESTLTDDELRSLLGSYEGLGKTKLKEQTGSLYEGGKNIDLYKWNPALDTSADVKRIQDLLQTRTTKEQGDNALSNLISSLPGELQSNEQRFIQGSQDQAAQTFEQNLMPEILAGLNARGLLKSGDLESELTNAAAGLQGDIQSEHLDVQAQDLKFFQDIAYNDALRKSLEAGGDVAGQVAFQRQQATQGQAQAFKASQRNLDQNLAQKLFQKQQERLLVAQENKARRDQDARERATRDALIGGIASAAGTIGGAGIATKLASPSKGIATG